MIKHICVLLILSDSKLKSSLINTLEAKGYFVVTTGSIADGFQMLRNMTKPSLIILEFDESSGEADTLLKKLKNDQKFSDIPVMQVSSTSSRLRESTCCSLTAPIIGETVIKMIEDCPDVKAVCFL